MFVPRTFSDALLRLSTKQKAEVVFMFICVPDFIGQFKILALGKFLSLYNHVPACLVTQRGQ